MTITISHGMPMASYPRTDYVKAVPSTKLVDAAQNVSSPTALGNSNSTQTNGTTTRFAGEEINPWNLAFCVATFILGARFIMYFEYQSEICRPAEIFHFP